MGEAMFRLFLGMLASMLLAAPPAPAKVQKLRVCVGDFPSYLVALDYLLANKGKYEVSLSTVHACSVRFKKNYFDLILADPFIYATNYLDAGDARIVSLASYSDGADQIVVQKGRGSEDLRGSRWALQRGTLSTMLLSFYLRRFGLTLRDVTLEDVKVENTPQAIGKTRFYGAVNWQPYTREAVARGGQVVATSADFQDKLFDFVVTRKSALEQHRSLIKAYLQERLVQARQREKLNASYAQLKKIHVEQAAEDFVGLHLYESAAEVRREQSRLLQNLRLAAEVADMSHYSGQKLQELLKLREAELIDFSLLE
jgi:ABC-type nitrate/sulfonate/bicarbonate transport system substrate-binding protein